MENAVETAPEMVENQAKIEVKVTENELREAISTVAKELSDRYRNGFTLVSMYPRASQYATLLSEELVKIGCRHMTANIGANDFVTETGESKILIGPAPSMHLTRRKPVVIMDLLFDQTSKLRAAATFLLNHPYRPATIECSALFHVGEQVPHWMQHAYALFPLNGTVESIKGFGFDGSDALEVVAVLKEFPVVPTVEAPAAETGTQG